MRDPCDNHDGAFDAVRMRRQVFVPCGDCGGSGRVLHGRMSNAVCFLERHEWRSTSEVATAIGIGSTNASNVLRRLHEIGLVERRGAGVSRAGQYEWRLSAKGARL